MGKTQIRTYDELIFLKTFEERLSYLKLDGSIGIETFGFDRYLNQALYRSSAWKKIRNDVIIRDSGCDLGILDRPIFGRVLIHHMNPITQEDIVDRNPDILNPQFLVCVSIDTHNLIHYGTDVKSSINTERALNDTCPWKN